MPDTPTQTRCPWPCECERFPIQRLAFDKDGIPYLDVLATGVRCEAALESVKVALPKRETQTKLEV